VFAYWDELGNGAICFGGKEGVAGIVELNKYQIDSWRNHGYQLIKWTMASRCETEGAFSIQNNLMRRGLEVIRNQPGVNVSFRRHSREEM